MICCLPYWISATDCILPEGKITQGRFSPLKTSFNHAAIIKKLVNKETLSKGLFSIQKEIYV